MENISEPADKLLSLSKMVRIDQICDGFDRAIHEAIQNRGAWPSIENYLGDTTEPVRSQLRKELLAVESSYRLQKAKGGDRNLLFGILALQMDFITREALVAAMHAWVLAKDKPLGEILVEQKALTADSLDLLEALVKKHLAMHDGDPG